MADKQTEMFPTDAYHFIWCLYATAWAIDRRESLEPKDTPPALFTAQAEERHAF